MSIALATEGMHSHETIIDERFERDLKTIYPLTIINGHPKIDKGDVFKAADIALRCDYNIFQGLSQQGFKFFYCGSEIHLKTEYGQEVPLLTQYYPEGDNSYFGPFLRVRNPENVPIQYLRSVIAILTKMFLNTHLKIEVNNIGTSYTNYLNSIGFIKINIIEEVGDVDIMMTPVFTALQKPINPSMYADALSRLYTDVMLINENVYTQFLDHVKDVLLQNIPLQVYQWVKLTKNLADKFEEVSGDPHFYAWLYRLFTHQTVYLLSQQGYNIDLEKGGTICLNVPAYTQNGKEFPPLQLSCYAKGGWILGKQGTEPALMPHFFVDVRRQMQQGQYVYHKVSFRHVVVSDKGIEEGSFLVVKKEETETFVYHLSGVHDKEEPFSILQRQKLDDSLSLDEFILPLPNDEADLNILSYLLAEIQKEEQNRIIEEQVQNIEKMEELPDDDLSAEEKTKFLEEKRSQRDQKIKELEIQKRQKEEDYRKREALFREEEIKKIEAELLKKDDYDQQVKREQEARTRQVIKDAAKPKDKRKGSVHSPQSSSARGGATVVPQQVETEHQRVIRIRLSAETIFNQRCVKLKDIAQRINAVLKINPEARSILFRQSGSHLVANGTGETSGPSTFVIPHGGDGTITKRAAETFLSKFIGLIVGAFKGI
ncbi:MAG: hypothetical protein KBD31_02985 [Proteobacteria bacterium]|nr:hypothetical protein [Pseudomonadota bacterium]